MSVNHAAEAAPAARRSVSLLGEGSGARAYTPTLWQARERQLSNERPKQERDSIRNRSVEGRPGSRKHRRWSQSQDLVRVLQKTMAARGEDYEEPDLTSTKDLIDQRPSVWYRLLEAEGPERALDAWAAAEGGGRRPRSRPRRPKTEAQVAQQNERAVRSGFAENWNYVHTSDASKDLLGQLEAMATQAFSSAPSGGQPGVAGGLPEGQPEAWTVRWDGETMRSVTGAAPSAEIVVEGLDRCQRRVVHQLARLLGLQSASRDGDYGLRTLNDNGDGRVLALRPPRRPCVGGRAWAAPLSVAGVLAAA